MRWPKYWSFSFTIIPSKEIPGLISFRMDWLDLLAIQGTLKSLFQHHSSKALILRCSAFFTVQLSHPYMTTGMDYTVRGILQVRILEWLSLSLLQVIFPNQVLIPGLPHCRQILYHLSHQGSPLNTKMAISTTFGDFSFFLPSHKCVR